jgi:hypothetical protein
MADQDDDESATSVFAKEATNAVSNTLSSAAKGAKVIAGKAAQTFGLAPGPGGDNTNFPQTD